MSRSDFNLILCLFPCFYHIIVLQKKKQTAAFATVCFWKKSDLLLNLGSLTDSVTQIVELRTSYLTDADDVYLLNVGRVEREGLLNAYAVRNSSDREGLGDSAAVLCNNGSLEHLDSFSRTLLDLVVNTDGVTDADYGYFLLQLLVCKSLDQIHFGPPKIPGVHASIAADHPQNLASHNATRVLYHTFFLFASVF